MLNIPDIPYFYAVVVFFGHIWNYCLQDFQTLIGKSREYRQLKIIKLLVHKLKNVNEEGGKYRIFVCMLWGTKEFANSAQ
jgi:hypothetical protein